MKSQFSVLTLGAACLFLSFASACGEIDEDSPIMGESGSEATDESGTVELEGVAGGGFTEDSDDSDSPVYKLAARPRGPAAVGLGTAAHFAILAKSGVSTVPKSAITGNLGVSPIASTAVTGFALILDRTGTFSTSSQIVGRVYAASYAVPTPQDLTTAVLNMQAAYADAAGRVRPNFTELGAGDISGLTLIPGLYKWGTGVLISRNITLNGGPNDVWIFQIAGGITAAPGVRVILAGGARPKNIFWQAAGAVALNTTVHFEGIVLGKTAITLATGASINGRLLAQTAVTLDASTVTQPPL